MNTNKIKNILLNCLGVIITALGIAICVMMVMYSLGYTWDRILKAWPEFLIVLFLTIMTRFFWYNSTEHKELTSEWFNEKTEATQTVMENYIKDISEFDTFLSEETLRKRDKFIEHRTAKLTDKNYKRNFFEWLFRVSKAKALEKYKYKIERKASKLKPLSSNNFVTLIDQKTLLMDDTNHAGKHKRIYQLASSVSTIATTCVFAFIAITKGGTGDWLRSAIYIVGLLVSIGQTVIIATRNTRDDYLSFYRRLVSIVESYEQWKGRK